GWLARRHAMGLKATGGRPRGTGKVRTMAERATEQIRQEIAERAAGTPADIPARPIESLAPAEALGRAALAGLHQLIRLIEQPIAESDVKQQRLIGDLALGVNRLFVRAAGAEFRDRRNDALQELLRDVAAAIDAEAEAQRRVLYAPQPAG